MNTQPYKQKARERFEKEFSGLHTSVSWAYEECDCAENDPKEKNTCKQKVLRFLDSLIDELAIEIRNERTLDAPVGVSQWREQGKKWGYWDFFEKEVRRETLEEAYNIVIRKRATDECQRCLLDAVHASRNKSNT